MKESKALTDRFIKASFFTKLESARINQALKLHQDEKMDLLDVITIFESTKNKAILPNRSTSSIWIDVISGSFFNLDPSILSSNGIDPESTRH